MKKSSLLPFLAVIVAITGIPTHANDRGSIGGTLILYGGQTRGGTVGSISASVVPVGRGATLGTGPAVGRGTTASTVTAIGRGGPANTATPVSRGASANASLVRGGTGTTTGGTLSSGFGLVKTGAGTLLINNGSVNFGGTSSVLSPGTSAGVLTLQNSASFGMQTVELVRSDFSLGGLNPLGGSRTITASNISGSTLTLNGANTYGGALTLSGANPFSQTSGATLAGGSLVTLNPNYVAGTTLRSNSTVLTMSANTPAFSSMEPPPLAENPPASVPEPGVAALLLIGLATSVCQRRRTREE